MVGGSREIAGRWPRDRREMAGRSPGDRREIAGRSPGDHREIAEIRSSYVSRARRDLGEVSAASLSFSRWKPCSSASCCATSFSSSC